MPLPLATLTPFFAATAFSLTAILGAALISSSLMSEFMDANETDYDSDKLAKMRENLPGKDI